MSLTFNDLPQADADLQITVNNIHQLLLKLSNEQQPEAEKFLTVQECAKFLSLSVTTVYGLTSKNKLSFMKRDKRCYFLKADLVDYLKAGRVKTIAELAQEADEFLARKG